MRRALLLVALAAPALGAAQIVASGAVVPVNPDGALNDKYINVEECDAASASTIELQWNVKLASGTPGAGVYRVWASNREIASGVTRCPKDGETEGLEVGQVGDADGILGRGGSTIGTATLPTATFVTGAGYTCASGSQTLYVCVDFYPYETGNIPATVPTGVAVGVLELSTSAPAAPGQPTTDPGDERLRVNFSAPSGGADRYRLVATPVDAAADPGGTRTREVTSSGNYIEGLVNDVTYTVQVVALSIAGNPSPPSPSTTGTPRAVDDFWDTYRNANGDEEGGCGLPGAGALALLGLSALLPRVVGFVGSRRRS
jgi:hypothetical protein